MKKLYITLFTICLMLISTSLPAQQTNGAKSVTVFSEVSFVGRVDSLAKGFMNENGGESVVTFPAYSGQAMRKLIDGEVQFALTARKITDEEAKLASIKSKSLRAAKVGQGDVCVVVNASNPVHQLTLDQVKKIFTGQITNWKDVGGEDLEIVPHIPNLPDSGVCAWWLHDFLDGAPLGANVKRVPTFDTILFRLAGKKGIKGAIGFCMPVDIKQAATRWGKLHIVRILGIKANEDAIPRLPVMDSNSPSNYPLKLTYYLYNDTNSQNPKAQRFANFLVQQLKTTKN